MHAADIHRNSTWRGFDTGIPYALQLRIEGIRPHRTKLKIQSITNTSPTTFRRCNAIQ